MNIFNLDSLCNMFVRPTRQTYKKSDLGMDYFNHKAVSNFPLALTEDVSIEMISHSLLDASSLSVLYSLPTQNTSRAKLISV
jgi:hypothetical protein